MAVYRAQRSYRRRVRRRARKVVGTTRSIAVRALKTAKYVRRVAKPEVLYSDQVTGITPGTTASLTLLNELSEGDAQGNRTADNVRMVTYAYNLFARKHASAAYDYVRIIFFVEKQPITVGTAPAANTILSGTGEPTVLRNPVYTSRYKVLMDRIITLDGAARSIQTMRGKLKLALPTRWTDGTDVNIEKNALWMFAVAADNTNKSSIVLQGRLFFTDA